MNQKQEMFYTKPMEKEVLLRGTIVEKNEYGNIAKIQETKIFAGIQGEHEHTFYYRVEKEANLSVDDESGEQFPVHCQIHIRYENEMEEDTLLFAHHIYYREQIARENEIELAHITPISEEQYKTEKSA